MRAAPLLIIAVLAAACGTPSRRLPRRAIDDPITLPGRTMEVSLGATGTFADRARQGSSSPIIGLSYGITDRLSWTGGLPTFEYALLDDAPVEHAATGARAAGAPLALSLSGGLAGFGYSSWEGAIFYPMVGVSLGRHLGRRVQVSGHARWTLGLSDDRPESWTHVSVSGAFQALDWMLLRLSLSDDLEFRGASGRRWSTHTLGVTFGPELRPSRWLDVGAGLRTEAWWGQLLQPPLLPPTEPLPSLPRAPSRRFPILWASLWATARW